MKTRLLFVPMLLVALAGCSRQSEHDAAIDSVVDAEHSFAKSVAEVGMKEAFLLNLAERSVIFRPVPADARASYESMEDAPGLLSWEPTLADASAAGDLGLTTGPWELRPDGAGTEAVMFGHYVSVWDRDADGAWKVAIDAGIPHARENGASTELVRRGELRASAPFEPPATMEDVLDAERDLWTRSAASGFAAALSAVAAPDMIVYRFGFPPATGSDAIPLLTAEGRASWEPKGGSVSASGDLAYTFGIALYNGESTSLPFDRASYLRLWERLPDGTWNVLIDLTNPIPKQQ